MDKDRLLEIAAKSLRLCVAASVLAIAHGHPAIGQNAIAKKALANELIVLLESVNTNQDLENAIENVWLHLKTVINKYLHENNVSEMDEKMENTLREPIRQIAKVDSPVRLLMCKLYALILRFVQFLNFFFLTIITGNRLEAYVRVAQTCKLSPPPPPPGYVGFEDELKIFLAFKSITFYNYTVFGEQYHLMLNKDKPSESNESVSPSGDGEPSTSSKISPPIDEPTTSANTKDTNAATSTTTISTTIE